MKTILLTIKCVAIALVMLMLDSNAHGQVASFKDGLRVGAKGQPDSKAVLDVVSTTKGFLPPRMTTAQREAIASPTTGLMVYDTTTLTVWQYNGSAWIEVGSGAGGSGGRNYIEANPGAETDTAGWVLYADAASSIPVDGVGGSAVITWDRTTSDVLAGDGSFLLTKDAANRQGNGVAFDFSIEREDRGKVLQIDYTYEIPSGTYATGDLSWHIYDVTNSRYIQPSAYQVENVGVSSHAQPLTFQTSIDSTSYRLILHVSSTSASAYTAKFDSVKIGPQNQANGPPDVNWTTYTPTVGALSGTLTNFTVSGVWKQRGDTADYKIRLVFTGAPGTWSQPTFTLPTGQVIDTTKIPGGLEFRNYYRGRLVDSSPGNNYELSSFPYTTSSILIQYPSTVTHSGTAPIVPSAITQAAPFTWASGDEMYLELMNVPIVGWSSNVVVSSSANTRPVTARYTTGTAGSYGTGGAVLDFPLKTDDSHGAVTTGASWRYTAKVPGQYRVSIGLSPSGTNGLYAELYKNGATYARLVQYRSGTNPPQLAGGTKINLLAGDYFNIVVFSETATTSLATAAHLNFIDVEKVDGPSQIAAENLVVARYTTAAGQSTNGTGSATLIDFGTKDFDLYNSVTTGASWKFTAPTAGYYELCTLILLAGTTGWADTEAMELTLYKNGSAHQRVSYREGFGSGSQLASGNGCGMVQLNASEYIDLRVTQLNGSNINLFANAQYNWVTVKKLGGLH